MEDEKFEKAINRLSRTTKHWLAVKKVLLEDIRSNQELIDLIDRRVKENERHISNLN